MLKRIGKNMTAILVALSVICAMCFAGYEIYDNFIKEESIYAVSRQGSTGNEVKSIQKKLKELGYYKGEIDGIYGSKTKSAVISFQKNCGLTADGICGKTTLLYLGLGNSSSSGGTGSFSDADVELLAKVSKK